MKFETVRIYLVKWRFWFVVWSKNFATVATWHKDFSFLLAKKQQQQPCTCAAHSFIHFFDFVSTTTMWNLMFEYVVCAHRCFVEFLFTFFLALLLIFTLLAAFSHFLTANFSVFPPTIFVSCFLSNALALLSTSLKTLKFSRTWLCCWFFSLLSPDGPSLSKKSRWT